MAERWSMGWLFIELVCDGQINLKASESVLLSNHNQKAQCKFILKANKIQNMSTEKRTRLTHSQLQDCKRQLFPNNQHSTQQNALNLHLYHSIANQPSTVPSKHSTTKKIKLKGRNNTEIPITPLKQSAPKPNPSPNKNNFMRSPLQEAVLNVPKPQRLNRSQFYNINETQQFNVKRFTSMSSEVEIMPSPQKKSLNYSRVNKSSLHGNSISKSQERKLSKSKKKIHFTVYQSKQKCSHQSPSKAKGTTANDYSIPYRYNSSIAIDLFSSNNKQRSQSKGRSNSKDSKLRSPPKAFKRDLMKSHIEQQNEDRIERTLRTLQRYKFVEQYIERWEIMEKIQQYIQEKEPQCKWPLLIVDYIFNRIRKDDSFQASLNK